MDAASSAPSAEAEILLREKLAEHRGRIAVVSSFGAESAVVLHMIAALDVTVPVIFIDTGKLFRETLHYRDLLVRHLGLADVRTARAESARIVAVDPAGALWQTEPDRCCWERKVEPLDEALAGFAAWITGRKRYQGGIRRDLPLVESGPGGREKINPLAGWSERQIQAHFVTHALPRHPLAARGYGSIGCVTCTRPTAPGEPARAGRWDGFEKTECGIHLPRAAPLGGELRP